jgi:NTE family protein
MVWDKRPAHQSVGLALGGGAGRGSAHVGVLEVLDEHRIPIHYLAGTSAGALVGGLYAAGVSPRRMVEIMRKIKWSSISSINWRSFSLKSLDLSAAGLPLGLLDMDKLITYLDSILGGPIRFEQLNVPFAAIATDITTGEMVVLNDGPIAPAIRASSAVPGIFTPYRRKGRLLVDGVIVNNLPVTVLHEMGAEYVIAVDLLAITGAEPREPRNVIELSMSALYTLVRATQAEAPRANLTIRPAISHIGLSDLRAAEELYAAGRAAAEAALPQIKADLCLE